MYHFEDNTQATRGDSAYPQRLLLDGTVNLDDSEDELTETNAIVAWLKRQFGLDAA